MKKYPAFFSTLLILLSIWYIFYSSKPQSITAYDTPLTEFSTMRALDHVKQLAKAPHYLGSTAHTDVQSYIISELDKLGLKTETQTGFSIYKSGDMSTPENIIAQIKGTDSSAKALLLLTHYDSATHSSYGASDAGSGVATILEGLRAYLATNPQPKNNIIICFTDAEEIGLNGADLFVKKHPWAKDIGLVLNFEARGSGGNSFMLMETNGKNGNLINEFSKASVQYPVTNSLAYSIYKMLPNDTDLTVFREQGDIEGFNFAFIDDHFDYHTANDTWQNLDLSTLQHQGSYLLPLLRHFATTDLSKLKSDKDYIYFNAPIVKLVSYPFSWIHTLWILAVIIFILLLFYGRINYRLGIKDGLKGSAALLLCILLAGGLTYGGWELLKVIYPAYNEIQHGFTYNGYNYIIAFTLLSATICFKIFGYLYKERNQASLLVPVLIFWIFISILCAFYLEGASYFIWLVYFGLIQLFVLIRQKKPNSLLMVVLSFPALYVLLPFIASFPVALGLKMLPVASVLTVLLFALLLPVFAFYKNQSWYSIVLLIGAVGFFIIAHNASDFNEERQKPNSLVYVLDHDENKANWATYDHILDAYTLPYFSNENKDNTTLNKTIITSKYGIGFSKSSEAPLKNIPAATVQLLKDTLVNDIRRLRLHIIPNREINRLDVYTQKVINFNSLAVNGENALELKHKNETYHIFTKRWNKKLFSYYVKGNEPLVLDIEIDSNTDPNFILFESSYDLLQHPEFEIAARTPAMMPKPFVLNDAVIVKSSFNFELLKKVNDSIVEIETEDTPTNE
ncbi:M20/M25/M40 family metallo-hydrolase [Aquimarina intermedia]|uniref:Vacuolar membrane protease n=1 Tax=Aquimarina intermedia TaxID=350814 RepID=A0A5S5CFC0_9FLAO|nr:M20/M25/M40 family metallo-hydrolase [Aquimarina intermedia]TYP76996.1 peptidase M28-like protein [Aquimarina intermedia]